MMEYNELKKIATKRGITMNYLAEQSGYKYHGFKKAAEAGRLKIKDWKVIAETLQMPLDHFINLEEEAYWKEISGDNSKMMELLQAEKEKNKLLRELLDAQALIIAARDKAIENYQKMLDLTI